MLRPAAHCEHELHAPSGIPETQLGTCGYKKCWHANLLLSRCLRFAFRVSHFAFHSTKGATVFAVEAVGGLRAWPACQFVCHLGRPSKSVADITVPCTATAAGVEPRTGDRGRGRGHRQCVPGKDKATERTARFTRLGRQPQISEHVAVFGIKHMSKHMKGSRTQLGLALWPSLSFSLSLSAVPKPSSDSNSNSESDSGFACLAFQCALILRFCCYVALVVAVDTNGYERLINQMYMHDNVLSAPESELAACGRQLAA